MATQNTSFTGPETTEALFAERQKFWGSFMNFTTGCIVAIIVLLAVMGIMLT